MNENFGKCKGADCVCDGAGHLIWVVDVYRWKHQLLCNTGGLIFLEVDDDIEVYDYVGEAPGFKSNLPIDSPPIPQPEDYMRCARCNSLILRVGRHQRYCSSCAEVAHREIKREWIRQRRAQARRLKTSNDDGSDELPPQKQT
ncbi:MAG: hypothetical protein ACE5PO_05665 [Candidatus Bathyarchaeia archaeon]